MSRRYSIDEEDTLGSQQNQYAQRHRRQQKDMRDSSPYYDEPAPRERSRPGRGPAAHPDSSYGAMAAGRHLPQSEPHDAEADIVSPMSPPRPPPHRNLNRTQQQSWSPRERGGATGTVPVANVTPGADNFGESAAGGMTGIAYSVADHNARDSGLEPMRSTQDTQQWYAQTSAPPSYSQQTQYSSHRQQEQQQQPGQSYLGYDDSQDQIQDLQPPPRNPYRDSRSSTQALGAAAIPPGSASPGTRTPSRSPHSFANDVYTDDPYLGYSIHQDPRLGVVDPNEIDDDGDEGLDYGRTRGPRTSMLSLGGHSTQSNRGGRFGSATVGAAAVGTAAVGGAAAAAVTSEAAGAFGNLVGRSGGSSRVASGARYAAVHNGNPDGTGYRGGEAYDLGNRNGPEKSEWLSRESSTSKKWKWVIIGGVVLLIIAGIVLGVVFGVVLKKKSSSSDSSESASGDTSTNGDLNINSTEIQKLLNNTNLHKVFPGIDYTPINTQYPDCLENPPSQNNVTRDLAVLSQLTNTIRLYGTDCNQTEMAIHAIKQLEMEDTMKIWMGVWQDANTTTNERQLSQMWTILDDYGQDHFVGVIVANEILYRKQMTVTELGNLLEEVRTNMTSLNISLPVATSDLGTVWDAALANASDYVMANIHPFFGGVNANTSAEWTYSFWENNDGPFFKSDSSKNIISETGWPSQGGTDCGSGSTETSCPEAAVAGITELNTFMADWVCQALTNGTQYFWFEAFDEPWKIMYNTDDENWEDHWGLLDVDRNLKPGVQIPDCDGKTV